MSDELTLALAGIKAESPPSSLFRFYRPETVLALSRGRLNLTPPEYFNDPFEMWAGVSAVGLPEATVLRSVTIKTGIFRAMMRANDPALEANDAAFEAQFTKIVKTRPDLAEQHFDSIVDSVRHSCRTQFGVVCFSAFQPATMQGPIGIRHWSMYAERHEGFVIEYDGHHEFFQNWAKAKWLFPVQYSKERFLTSLSDFDEWNDAKMWQTFRRWSAMKSLEAWGHENEWRIVCPLGAKGQNPITVQEKNEAGKLRDYLRFWRDNESPEQQQAGARAIRRVMLGLGAKKETRDTLLAAIEHPTLAHVEVWQTRACRTNYALEYKRVK